MPDVPRWSLRGDWFDVCKCNIPCPCTFAQPPTFGDCDGVLAFHVREGRYGRVRLDGLNLVMVGYFNGNIWAGAKVTGAIFMDARANEQQREALQAIFGGRAGGWPGEFAKLFSEIRGVEVAPIAFEVADDLAYWRVEVPGKAIAAAEALTGPTSVPGKRCQTHNPPGAEMGPGSVATWGKATVDRADAFGFTWNRSGQSSKHMSFDWTGP